MSSISLHKRNRHWNNEGNFKVFETWVLKDLFLEKEGGDAFQKITEIDSLKNFFFVKSLSSMQILEKLGTRKKVRWRRVDSLKILHFLRTVLPGQNICASILEVFIEWNGKSS